MKNFKYLFFIFMILVAAEGLSVAAKFDQKTTDETGSQPLTDGVEIFPEDKQFGSFGMAKDEKKSSEAPQNPNLLNGPIKNYYDDGKVSSEEHYLNGKKEGLQQYYDPSGILRKEQSYHNDLETGGQRFFDESGRLQLEYEAKDGLQNGTFKRYKENGLVWETRLYKNDRRINEATGANFNGPYEVRYDNGAVYLREDYVDGFVQGKAARYYENGALKEEREYKDGKKHGLLKDYLPNGKIKSEVIYKNDVENGPAKLYYPSGALQQEINFIDGNAQSTKLYYPQGNLSLREEINLAKGLLAGEAKQYYRNGQLKSVSQYKDGKEDRSTKKAFYADGSVKTSEPFDDPEKNLLIFGVLCYFVFLFSLTFHEASHAFAALKLGDNTAYQGGQVSLNPLPHIRREILGTVVVPIVSLFSGRMIGWGSAPYDVQWALKYPKRSALMALAGPLSNLVLIVVSITALIIGYRIGIFEMPDNMNFAHLTEATLGGFWPFLAALLSAFLSMNIVLFVFNMMPLPPLDGSGIVPILLPHGLATKYMQFMKKPFLVFGGLFLAWRWMDLVYDPVFSTFIRILYPGIM